MFEINKSLNKVWMEHGFDGLDGFTRIFNHSIVSVIRRASNNSLMGQEFLGQIIVSSLRR